MDKPKVRHLQEKNLVVPKGFIASGQKGILE